jgi:ADP-heptose:LPS heptosyltransferase
VKVLITRTDKLGDVVLSLPAIAWLKAHRTDWEIHALVASRAVPLVEHDPALARVWTWPDDAPRLAAARFDAAVLLVYDRAVAAHLRRIGVRRRVGPLSRWTSWLLLSCGVWQRRSRGGRHERDYNVGLVAALAREEAGGEFAAPRLALSGAQRKAGRRFRATAAPGAAVVAFVHAGSGGSALGWPPERFGAVAARLAARDGWRLFLTGGESDGEAVAAAAAAAGPAVTSLAGRYDLRELLGVLSGGDLMVAPSTGPLHLAAALGLAAVGVMSPVPVQSAERWGPLGPRARSVAPDVLCPARLACLGPRCRLWNCLETVGVDTVVAAAIDAVAVAGDTDGRLRG